MRALTVGIAVDEVDIELVGGIVESSCNCCPNLGETLRESLVGAHIVIVWTADGRHQGWALGVVDRGATGRGSLDRRGRINNIYAD